uniref:Uncharacterized protein n=1 Tax=Ditylenchus dipsaci TaxID=166011 RepID=A0A915EEZ3_9BILA
MRSFILLKMSVRQPKKRHFSSKLIPFACIPSNSRNTSEVTIEAESISAGYKSKCVAGENSNIPPQLFRIRCKNPKNSDFIKPEMAIHYRKENYKVICHYNRRIASLVRKIEHKRGKKCSTNGKKKVIANVEYKCVKGELIAIGCKTKTAKNEVVSIKVGKSWSDGVSYIYKCRRREFDDQVVFRRKKLIYSKKLSIADLILHFEKTPLKSPGVGSDFTNPGVHGLSVYVGDNVQQIVPKGCVDPKWQSVRKIGYKYTYYQSVLECTLINNEPKWVLKECQSKQLSLIKQKKLFPNEFVQQDDNKHDDAKDPKFYAKYCDPRFGVVDFANDKNTKRLTIKLKLSRRTTTN